MRGDRHRSIYLPPWRVDVVTRPGVEAKVADAAIARAVAGALAAARAPEPGAVTVVLTDDEELADLNREHMGIDGPTDVLSFPMLPPESFLRLAPGDPGPRHRKPSRGVGGERVQIGDIAISVERAFAQAAQGQGGQTGDVHWSPADELLLLVTHGTLHLCGWDHAEPAEEAAMRALEKRLLG